LWSRDAEIPSHFFRGRDQRPTKRDCKFFHATSNSGVLEAASLVQNLLLRRVGYCIKIESGMRLMDTAMSLSIDLASKPSAAAPDVAMPHEPVRTKIDFQAVTKAFGAGPNRMLALDNVGLSIADGQFVSILGESGCGKTTLLRIVAGLILATSGRVLIDGAPVTKPSRDMGFVFQQSVLLEWRTVLENILLPVEIFKLQMQEYREKALDLLRMMGLSGFESHYPIQLSGGMQQRVSIARALILSPSVLLMDEPFGALDAITREQMNMELLRIWSHSRTTAVFVTHDIAEAAFLSDRVVILGSRPGRVRKIFDIDLPRPRVAEHRFDERFTRLCRDMKHAMSS
jgi:NitT/TauT family transport system ATP-binding protein